jgi:uncharacterized FlaG/YvyC family protein
MIEPILRTKESDTTKYNDYFSNSKSNQKSSLNAERLAQQKIQNAKKISKPIENLEEPSKDDPATTVTVENAIANNTNNSVDEQTNKVAFGNMAEKLREITGMTQVYFQFELSEENKKDLIMKVRDKETHEVIQQYPSEISLKIAQMIEDYLGRGQIANATV